MIPARRLDDPPLAGAENMARDEALLELRTSPTLRFYSWMQPTLSLGYFQKAAALPLAAVRDRGGEVVRRPTGGKAILHENELTYALCVPEVGPLAGGPARAMRALHAVLAGELSRQLGRKVVLRGRSRLRSDEAGSPWCFLDSSPLDLACRGRKLLGSAARRRNGWILFHGSLPLQPARETPGTASFGGEPDRGSLARAIGNFLGCSFQPGSWSPMERAEAKRLGRRHAAREFVLRL
ncbi:MAG: biotin/lipoate A/B protein ligase family protein [Planctomycetota bacterium]